MTREPGVDMDVEDIKAALHTALPMRPPRFRPEEGAIAPSGGQKAAALEDYLLESAFVRAELEEALHWLDSLVAHFKAQVEQMTGYEALLPRKPQDRITQTDINTAKRGLNPVIFDAGAEAKQLRASVLRQIERFEFEAQWVVSRAYSMISGS